MGCDFVGEVVSVGAQVPQHEPSNKSPTDSVHPGQLRWGFFRGGFISPKTGAQKGAFAEYLTIDWDLTAIVPKNISAEQAASIPIPYATTVSTLLNELDYL
jgi:NADPH:quinone reductase-like Zn-dependent oxidoreductase